MVRNGTVVDAQVLGLYHYAETRTKVAQLVAADVPSADAIEPSALPPPFELWLLGTLVLHVTCALFSASLNEWQYAPLPYPPARGRRSVPACLVAAWFEVRNTVVGLLQKVLGFVLGQAWYTCFVVAYPDYSSYVLGRVAAAAVASVLCTTFILVFGKESAHKAQPTDGTQMRRFHAAAERERHHRVMLALSFGMIQH